MTQKLGLVLLQLLVTMAAREASASWSWHNYPNPQEGDGRCGLPKGEKSWVCDPNSLLPGPDSIRQLDGLIQTVFNTSICPCAFYTCEENHQGYSIAVALVSEIQKVQDGAAMGEDELWDNLQLAHVFALHTYKKWGLGKCDNHILIVYSPMDNSTVVYTLSGATTQRKLSNSDVVTVTSHVLPQLGRNPDGLFQGLWKMISDYRAILEGSLVLGTLPPVSPQPVYGGDGSALLPYILLTVVSALLAALC